MCWYRKLPHPAGKILTPTLILGRKPVTVCLSGAWGPTTNKAIRNGPPVPKAKLLVILERTPGLARTDGRAGR